MANGSDENVVVKVMGEVTQSARETLNFLGNLQTQVQEAGKVLQTATSAIQELSEGVVDLASSVTESVGVFQGFTSKVSSAITQLSNLKNSTDKLQQGTLIMTGVFTAATTAIYKYVKGVAEAELNTRSLAKQNHKTTESYRATQTALESMGKTLKEVKADKELKATYDELVKINKEMSLPNIDSAITSVKNLRSAYWELRDTFSYVVDWIGARVLANLEEPINRITDKLKSISDWLRSNLDSVSMKISSYITAFIKGVEGIVEGFTSIVEMVGELDSGIGKIGSSLLVIWALIQSGPIGQLIALITEIGAVIDDAENFQYNQAHNLTKENPYSDANGNNITEEEYNRLIAKGEEAHKYVRTALTGIWEGAFDENGALSVSKLAETIIDKLTEALENAFSGENGEGKVGKLFAGENGEGGLIGSITTWLNNHTTQFARLGTAFATFISGAINAIGSEGGGFMGQIIDALLGDGASGEVGTDSSTGATFLSTTAGAIGRFLKVAKEDKSFIQKIVETVGSGFFSGILTSILSNVEKDGNAIKINWDDVSKDISSVGGTIVEMVKRGLRAYTDLAKDIFTVIGEMLVPEETDKATLLSTIGTAFEAIGRTEVLGETIIAGITGALTTKSLGGGLVAAIGDLILQASEDPDTITKLREDINNFWNGWDEVIYDEYNPTIAVGSKRHKGFYDSFLDVWLGQETLKDGISQRAGGIKEVFTGIIDDIWLGAEETVGGQKKRSGGLKSLIFGEDWEKGDDLHDADGLISWFVDLFDSIVSLASQAGSSIWDALYLSLFNSLPPAVQQGIKNIFGDPNVGHQTIETDENGNTTLETGNGRKNTVNRSRAETLSGYTAYEYLQWDENDKPYFIDLGDYHNNSLFNDVGDTLTGFWNSLFGKGSYTHNEFWKDMSSYLSGEGNDEDYASFLATMQVFSEYIEKARKVTGQDKGVKQETTQPEPVNNQQVEVEEEQVEKEEEQVNVQEADVQTAEINVAQADINTENASESSGSSESSEQRRQELESEIYKLLSGAHVFSDEEGPATYRVDAETEAQLREKFAEYNQNYGGGYSVSNGFVGADDMNFLEKFKQSYMTLNPVTEAEPEPDTNAKKTNKYGFAIVASNPGSGSMGNWQDHTGSGESSEEGSEAQESIGKWKKYVPEKAFSKTAKTTGEIAENLEEIVESTQDANSKANQLLDKWEDINEELAGAVAYADEFGGDVEDADTKVDGLTTSMGELTDSARSAASEVQALKSAINSLQNKTVTVTVNVKQTGDSSLYSVNLAKEKAWGGRIGQEQNNVTVGEDGTEYIIPITKPSRAAQLIKQMFGEMGTSAVSRIIGDLGIGLGGNTVGESYASLASAIGGGSSITNNNTVSAPVNIYVSASGVGAESVGERAYDAAERHMLRTLKGVFA